MKSSLKPVPALHKKLMLDQPLSRDTETADRFVSNAECAELAVNLIREGEVLVSVELHEAAPFLVGEVSPNDHIVCLSVERLDDSTVLSLDGIEQPIVEWALDYGITPTIIIGRLERGTTIADAITMPMKTGYRGQKLSSPDIEAFIRTNSKRWGRERRRARKRNGPEPQTYTFDGKTLSIPEWSKLTGLKIVTIRARLYAGWDIAKALTSLPDRSVSRPKKNTRAALAREVGINPRTVDSRLSRGWSTEDALAVKPMKRRLTGMARADLEKAAARIGIAPGTVWSRLDRGWSLERALSQPPGHQRGKAGVVSDFTPSEGTGAGRTAQETPDITFSGIEA